MKSIIQLQQELEDCSMELEQESLLGNTQQIMSIMESTTIIPSSSSSSSSSSLFVDKNNNIITAAICAIQKNGLYYIDEWVDYHLAIGFATIYIYDNSDENELLSWSMGRNPNQIQVIHWPGSKQQKLVYKHCSITQKQKQHNHHKWLAMIDIDEFIVLDYNKYNSILDLLEDFVPEDKAGLVLNRVNFYFSYYYHNNNNRSSSSKSLLLNLDEDENNNNLNDYEQIIYRPVLQRFQHRLNWEDWYKTIAKTDRIILPNVHGHSYSRRRHAVDILGNNVTQIPLPHPQGINGTPAIIYHYQTYSLKEFQSKCQRGDAAWGKYVVDTTTTTTATNTTTSSPTNDMIYNEINTTNTNTTNTTTKRHPSIIGNQESCLPSEEIQERFYSRRKGAIPGIYDDRPWKFLQKNVPVYKKYTKEVRRGEQQRFAAITTMVAETSNVTITTTPTTTTKT